MTVVLFDYGGVLGDHHIEAAEQELADWFHCGITEVRSLLSEKSEQGALFRANRITEPEFWRRVAARAGLAEVPAPDDVLMAAWCRTYKPNDQLFAMLSSLRQEATVGVVTNIDEPRSRYLMTEVRLMDHIDVYFPSYVAGVTKKAPEFWRWIRAQVAGRVMYVDDRQEHVDSAARVGFATCRYDGDPNRLADVLSAWVREDGAR
ncbi:HAD family hydrolase [Kibdelosporangium lantanae]|uniref:HAD family hydrolase n=1 Tax=Kibdelosporangium lantanae TaxID=1497396 RepID=A0ABW3MEA2_9PSEU